MTLATNTLRPAPISGDDLLTALLKRDRAIVIAGIGLLSLISWVYLFMDSRQMGSAGACCEMMSADMSAWRMSDLLMLGTMWSVMMVAMMAPSAAPMVLTFASVNRRRKYDRKPYVPTAFFLLGYLLAWTLFSILATVMQAGLHAGALLSSTMVSSTPWLAGSLLLAAGVFQFTPLKRACLAHCRSPLEMIMSHWREGRTGALRMGLSHGLFCLGCCWALMLLLFVLGVMNLLWIAILSAFVLLEKLTPGPWIARTAGAFLIAWSAAVMMIR